MKLLDGTFDGTNTSTTTAGPKYADYNGTLGAFITSDIGGIKIATNVSATVGGESAIWSGDGKTLTISLANNKTYTQADFDDLIKNAKQEDSTASNTPANVTVKLATGVYTATGTVTTGGTVAGKKASKRYEYIIFASTPPLLDVSVYIIAEKPILPYVFKNQVADKSTIHENKNSKLNAIEQIIRDFFI